MAASIPPLKTLFTKRFDFVPTSKIAKAITAWRTIYENRDTNAEALNTPLLGVFRLKFLPKDSDALFDILDVNKEEFESTIEASSINTDFIVASDSFNLLVVWAVHKFFTSNLPANMRNEVCTSLFYMLIVKFFSSFVHHMLPYGARQDVMEATIDNLSDKFDIKHAATCTWKLVMLARAAELLDSKNIHYSTIKTFTNDQRVTYVLTDTQTRIRTKVKLVLQEYREMLKNGKAIRESQITDDDVDGEKIIKELENHFDTMVASVTNRVLNINQFIKTDFVKIACAKSANVSPDMLRQLLIKFSTTATYQYNKHKQDEIDKQGNYRGYVILIRNIIQRTYRACIIDKVKMNSKLAILDKTCNLYKSSRINDPDILKVKSSVDAIVSDAKISSRDATNASLKISFIVYIILMTFDLD